MPVWIKYVYLYKASCCGGGFKVLEIKTGLKPLDIYKDIYTFIVVGLLDSERLR